MTVIAFEPRRPKAPELQFVAIRLLDETCNIELTAHDDAGNVVTLEYTLVAKPETFDMNVLRTSWDAWRGRSEQAS